MVRNNYTARRSHWEVFTPCCCWIGIPCNCALCYNIISILEECVCCHSHTSYMCQRVRVFLVFAPQVVWWCGSHLVCVLGWQGEWITSKVDEKAMKGYAGPVSVKYQYIYLNACSRCVWILRMCKWSIGRGRQRKISIGCSFSEMTNTGESELTIDITLCLRIRTL